MYPVSNPQSQGPGTQKLDRFSQNSTDRMPSRPETDVYRGRLHHMRVDDVRISGRAQVFVGTQPTDIPPPGDSGGNGDLLKAARQVNGFLEENSRIANSPFGKTAGMLVRGAVHLAKGEGSDVLTPESNEKLMRTVAHAREFLRNHPRVAESPFGQAVAKLGGEIAAHSRAGTDDPGLNLPDKVVGAAKKTSAFLEAHPEMARMPLGQAVDKLINGVQEMGDGKSIDADVQQLAKRIGNFVHNLPRLAQSEFGQLVSNLTRGILALDTTLPPEVGPPVAGDVRPEIDPAVSDRRPSEVARPVVADVTRVRAVPTFLEADLAA